MSGLKKPIAGENGADTIFSAGWLGELVDAATGSRRQHYPEENRRSRLIDGIVFKAYVKDGTPTAIKAHGVFGAFGINPAAAATIEPKPLMQSTLGRSHFIYRTGSTGSFAEATGQFYGFPIGDIPVRLRAKTPAASGYLRKYIPGLPCGRAIDRDDISADEGGLILVTKPFREGASGDYYCYVVRDSVQIWDAFIIKPSSAEPSPVSTPATAYLTGRGTYKAGFLTADPSTVAANRLKDIITDARITLHPRDPAETYEDGTYVQVIYRNNEWKVLWSSCAAVVGLTGKSQEPA